MFSWLHDETTRDFKRLSIVIASVNIVTNAAGVNASKGTNAQTVDLFEGLWWFLNTRLADLRDVLQDALTWSPFLSQTLLFAQSVMQHSITPWSHWEQESAERLNIDKQSSRSTVAAVRWLKLKLPSISPLSRVESVIRFLELTDDSKLGLTRSIIVQPRRIYTC